MERKYMPMAINRIRVLVELLSRGLDTSCLIFFLEVLPSYSQLILFYGAGDSLFTPEGFIDSVVVATTENIQAVYRRSPLIRDVSSRSLLVISALCSGRAAAPKGTTTIDGVLSL